MVARDYFVRRNDLDDSEKDPFVFFEVDENTISSVEMATWSHAESAQWQEERKFRLTASKFDRIVKKRHHEKFANDQINPKPFSSRSVDMEGQMSQFP